MEPSSKPSFVQPVVAVRLTREVNHPSQVLKTNISTEGG